MISKRILFKTSNLYAQDGIVDEYEIDKECRIAIQGFPIDVLQEVVTGEQSVASPLGEVSIPDFPELGFIHLYDYTYDIVGYVYDKNNSTAFLDIGDFVIAVCDSNDVLEVEKTYTGQVKFIFDPWNCYGLWIDDTYQDTIEIKGIVKSITLDSSLYEKNEKNEWVKDSSKSKYDVRLEKTSCWEDENHSNGPVNYLIEIEANFEEPMTLRPMTDEEMMEDEGMQEIFAAIHEKINGQRQKAESGDVPAMFNLGELAYNSKDYENAFKHWRKAIRTDFKIFVNELRSGFATYCKGALSVMAEFDSIGMDADTAIPVCNDFDKEKAINFYLDRRFGQEQWKAINKLTEGAILSLEIEHHEMVEKIFFNIANFYDESGFNSPSNWDFHDL